ncbi:hypothetical protein GN956_G3647 [Arapaima gigas]
MTPSAHPTVHLAHQLLTLVKNSSSNHSTGKEHQPAAQTQTHSRAVFLTAARYSRSHSTPSTLKHTVSAHSSGLPGFRLRRSTAEQ